MFRREFVMKSLAGFGSAFWAGLAKAQEAVTDDEGMIDIPGVGRFSLNPADYDAEAIAKLLSTDFSGGVEKIRQHYGGAIKALSSGDTKQLATLAGPLIKQAARVTQLPVVGDGLRDALVDPAKPEVIAMGSGAKIYYVNGIFTPQATAQEEARQLAKQLPGHSVSLFYNEGVPPDQDPRAAGKDVEEAFRDRVWPLQLTRLMRGKSLGTGLSWAVGSAVEGGSPLQHNPTTRQLAGLLYETATKQPTAKVAIVGYSQGAMIVRNALFTLAVLGKQSFVENNVAFVAPGLPINNYEVWPVPKKFTPLVDPQDPIPALLGLHGDGFKTKQVGLKHHQWFEDGYVSRIKPEMLRIG